MTAPHLFERAHALAAVAYEEKRNTDLTDTRTIILDSIRPLAFMLKGLTCQNTFPASSTKESHPYAADVAPEIQRGAATAAEMAAQGADTTVR